MFTLKPFSKSLAICSTLALSQLSAVHAMDVESKVSSKAPKKRVTFTADDVIKHVSGSAKFFDMEYLRSSQGKADISAFINKYNTDGMPQVWPNSFQTFDDCYMTQIAWEISNLRVKEGHFEFPQDNRNSLDDM